MKKKTVPPRWIREPQDTALMLGNAVVIECSGEYSNGLINKGI